MTHSFPTRRSSDLRELQDEVVGAPRCHRIARVLDDDLDLDHTVTSLGLGAANQSKLALGQCRLFHRHERLFGPVVALHLQRVAEGQRSEEHTSELQSLMRTSYAVFCLKKKK